MRTVGRLGFSLTVLCVVANTQGDDDSARAIRFNRDVLPILADNCSQCHGFDAAQRQAGLRLDQPDGALAELDSGLHAIVPGNPKSSAVWQRVSSPDDTLRMPPEDSGYALNAAERDVLFRWIQQGADYEPHWAYLPPVRSEPPHVDGTHHAIDAFIRARLQREGLASATAADRHTWLRRVTLDLTGLPPTIDEIEAFITDRRPDAFERVVDRLLASEHFGEHWARWWLDLAHYADSDGYLQDFLRPVAWRYRQWVVDAFNADMPFDQFTIEQLAGDLLPNPTVSQRMGTGFLRNTLNNREGGADLEEFRVNQVVDRVNTVATTWLALTVECAQCHDHKFDAITQREFYQLYAFFNAADEVNFNAPLPAERDVWASAQPEYRRRHDELLAPFADRVTAIQTEWERRLLHAEQNPGDDFAWDRTLELLGLQWGQDLGEGQLEGLNIVKTPVAERSHDQRTRLLDYFLHNVPADFSQQVEEVGLNDLLTQLDELKNGLPPVTRAPGMMQSAVPRTTWIHIRGDFRRPGEVVRPNTPAALPAMPDNDPDRLSFARWLVSPDHPLTSRVVVNRLWQQLFGRGLVSRSNNFGVRGDLPSHPALLDWLAVEFQENGWRMKRTLRQIVLSQTYRQSSAVSDELLNRDPQNILLARQSRLPLTGEQVRDVALAASGLLDRTVGGPSVNPPQPESVTSEAYRNTWETSPGSDRWRRGLYTFLQRTTPYPQFVTFDLPDTSRSCTCRERNHTPLQALNLLNDPVFIEAAMALSERVLREGGPSDQARLRHAFLLTLGRPPRQVESDRLLEFLELQRRAFTDEAAVTELESNAAKRDLNSESAAWSILCSVLLNLDEAITRE